MITRVLCVKFPSINNKQQKEKKKKTDNLVVVVMVVSAQCTQQKNNAPGLLTLQVVRPFLCVCAYVHDI